MTHPARQTIENAVCRARAWAGEPAGKRWLGRLRLLVVVGIIAFLGHRLTAIGWVATLRALPTAPGFYLAFLGFYFSLPICEYLIYRGLWRLPVGALMVFVQKRIMNDLVVDYSGDGFLYLWARKRTGRPAGEVGHTVKDVAILSGLAGNLVTVGLLLWLFLGGKLGSVIAASPSLGHYLFIPGLIVVGLMVAIIALRRQLFRMPLAKGSAILAVHTVRQLLTLGFLVTQWSAALPQVAWSTWMVFLASRMALSRVPLLPNKDLAFVSIGIGLGGLLDATPARIAAMFLAEGILMALTHLLMFSFAQAASWRRRVAAY